MPIIMPLILAFLIGLSLNTLTLLQMSCISPTLPITGTFLPLSPFPLSPPLNINWPLLGVTELPSTTLTLAYIVVGHSVQNYTCSALSVAPVTISAIATLYDATTLASYYETIVHAILLKAVYIPLSLATAIYKKPAFILPLPIGPINVLSHHYFDSASTPTFDLSSVRVILYYVKKNEVKALVTTDKGPTSTEAVNWLFLTIKDRYTSVSASTVY